MPDQEGSRPIQRTMMRCVSPTCRVWQTVLQGDAESRCGACGGELELVQWDFHFEALPRAPYDPSKDPKR